MKKSAKILIVIIVILSHLYSIEVHCSAFYNLSMFLLALVVFIHSLINKESLQFTIPDILVLVFALYLFINNIFQGSFTGNSNLFQYLTLLLLYSGLRIIFQNDKDILRYILFGILASIYIEGFISFGQIFGLVQNTDTKFIVGGLFGNPGALAGFLSTVAPFLFVIILNYKKLFQSENLYYALICGFLCAIYLIISSNSRGAWIATFIGVVLALNHRYKTGNYIVNTLKTKTLKISGLILLLFIVMGASFALYNYKPDSAFGRLFIWKTSLPMTKHNPVFGNGFGSFANNYGKVQATYFLENTPTEKEIQVADYVACAYNEFLEMMIDSGVIGLLLFIAILYFALKPQLKSNSEYYFAAKYSLVSLLVLSMVSYPLGLTPNVMMLVIALFIIFNNGNNKAFQIGKFSSLFTPIWFLLMFGLIYLNSTHAYGTYHFQKGYKKVLNNNIESGLNDYKVANHYLKNDGIFQFYYGSALYLSEEYTESIKHLTKATQQSSNPNAFIVLGNSLKELERYDEAIKAYRTASGITPAKLYPKYLLAKLYEETNQNNKAVEMAKQILKMKEKTQTTAGSEIKNEMKQIINNAANIKAQ